MSSGTNVWSQMSYVFPRGRCAYKSSLVVPSCSCLRFMIHPVKAATSFECDGCGHHASFHQLENKEEREIIARWQTADRNSIQEASRVSQDVQEIRAPKRKRMEAVESSTVRPMVKQEEEALEGRPSRMQLEDVPRFVSLDGAHVVEHSESTRAGSGRRKSRGGMLAMIARSRQ